MMCPMSHKKGIRYSKDFKKIIIGLYHTGKSLSEFVSKCSFSYAFTTGFEIISI